MVVVDFRTQWQLTSYNNGYDQGWDEDQDLG